VKAVVFDIDGTLVDSVDLHARAWLEAFALFGHKLSFAEVRKQIGKGGDQLMPVFLSKEEIRRSGELLEKIRGDIYKQRYMKKVEPFPKVRELFSRIKSDGLQIALASSAKGDELEYYKKLINVDDLMEAHTSADDADKSKPHPDIFQAALAKLDDVAPEDAIVVGDTPYDAIASHKAGMPSIGVLCGGFPEYELRSAGCIEIYRDPADLLAKYKSSVIGKSQASDCTEAA
jgi:HAD superfamily hydrolase (TIGR01509 family)